MLQPISKIRCRRVSTSFTKCKQSARYKCKQSARSIQGNIVGRNGGIRAWLSENVPDLSPRYKTIMRYKALAMRVRQLAGIADPVPTSALLDGADAAGTERSAAGEAGAKEGEAGMASGAGRVENYYAYDSHSRGAGRERTAQAEPMPHGLERSRRRIRRMLADCRNSFRDVFGRIDAALGQDGGGDDPGWG